MIALHKVMVLATFAAVFSSGMIFGAMSGGNSPRASGDAGGLDYGLDADGNGLFDYLVVIMPLNVEKPDYFSVFAQLTGKSSPPSDCFGYRTFPEQGMPEYPISYAQVRVFLEKGDNEIKLAFKGKEINAAGADGPYVVKAWAMSDSDMQYRQGEPCMTPNCGGYPLPELAPWEYTTGSYKYTDFEEPTWAIRFTGSNSDRGVDVNGNGLFDILRVSSEVKVNLAGNYQVSAILMKQVNWTPGEQGRPEDPWNYPQMTLYVYYWGQVDLSEGIQVVDFDLSGEEIQASGVDGPYDVYLSANYMFDYYPYPYPYHNETDPGWIDPGIPGQPPPPMPPSGWRDKGVAEQDFDFYYDFACHETQAYLHDQFDVAPPDVVFTGEFADEGIDWNANGLYDELQVGVGIEVFRSGYFEVDWTLSSEDGSQAISWASDQLYLDAGKQTVTARFPGGTIKDSGIDGPYQVHINILRIERPRDPEADYLTSSYTHDQFEGYGGSNNTRSLWIGSLEVRAQGDPPAIQGAAAVTIMRGPDMLTVVMDGTVELTISDSNGNIIFTGLTPRVLVDVPVENLPHARQNWTLSRFPARAAGGLLDIRLNLILS